MSMLSNLELLRRVPLFAMLTATQAEAVAEAIIKRRFKRGEQIVEQGKKSNALFIISKPSTIAMQISKAIQSVVDTPKPTAKATTAAAAHSWIFPLRSCRKKYFIPLKALMNAFSIVCCFIYAGLDKLNLTTGSFISCLSLPIVFSNFIPIFLQYFLRLLLPALNSFLCAIQTTNVVEK